MGEKVIRFGLSDSEISRAVRELEEYKQEIIRKTEILRERVAEKITELSQNGFDGAVVDDLVNGGQRTAQVEVNLENRQDLSIVFTDSKDAVWVEFGTGVYHNGSAGSSPHPKGQKIGYTIGGYGKGMGKRNVWGYYEEGELRLTHGAPATMPMYNAVKMVCDEISAIAKEVFK